MDWELSIIVPPPGDVPGTSAQRAQVRQCWSVRPATGFQNLNRGQTSSVRPDRASKPSVFCPWCWDAFGRKQELKRHILSLHLPYWICCPHPLCPWRGTRTEELKKHMRKGRCGPEARLEQCTIYETKRVFDCIFGDSDGISINVKLRLAETYALEFVLERAMELQKVKLWRNLWGPQPE
jgi:hypothetical protein